MKNPPKPFLLLIISLIFYQPCFSNTKGMSNDSIIAPDSLVRAGELSNGLTFYIRHNDTQPHQASFYLVQRVGSILEDENQRGLAHFLEHMCFDGTNYFPEQTITHFLQSKGVKFGFDLNAATGFDKTIYNIEDVPLATPKTVDSCVYVLSEWAHSLTLDSVAVEKERKVIHEEWRNGMTSGTRMLEKAGPELFPNCKYANRSPIGTMDIIDHFPIQRLKEYYNKWYRPDLQAIIVVGDVDVDAVQKRILQFFRHTYLDPKRTFRAYEPVSNNEGGKPLISIQTDPEETQLEFRVMFKRDIYNPDAKDRHGYYAVKYTEKMVQLLCDQRISNYAGAEMPILSTEVTDGNYLNSYTKDALSVNVLYKKGELDNALQAVFYELGRIRELGFTEKEYKKVKNDFLATLDNKYNNRQNITNNEYIQQYVDHFLENEPFPSISDEYHILKKFIDEMTLPVINYYLRKMMDEKNMVVYCTGPNKKGYKAPKKEDILDNMKIAKDYDLKAWVDDDDDDNTRIMKHLPKQGSIISETKNEQLGTTEMKLSNGATVIIKKIDTKQDEVKMIAVANGGLSLFPESYAPTLQAMDFLAGQVGFGSHYAGEMKTLTNGMTVEVKPEIGRTLSTMSGHCSVKEVQPMLQIAYLRFAKPLYSIHSLMNMENLLREYLRNRGIKPEHVFRDSLMNVVLDYSPRALALNKNLVYKIKYGQLKDIYNGCFGDASKYTFIFSGNIDAAALRPFIKQYIASLPFDKSGEACKAYATTYHKGPKEVEFKQNMFTQKGTVGVYQSGTCEYTAKNKIMIDMAAQIMEDRLLEKIRQKEGAVYSIHCDADIDSYPSPFFNFTCIFDVNPDKIKIAAKEVDNVFDYWKEHAPTVEEINKVKEFNKKRYEQNIKLNDYWLSILSERALANIDCHTDYCKTVENITPIELQQFISGLIKQNNRVTVTMHP